MGSSRRLFDEGQAVAWVEEESAVVGRVVAYGIPRVRPGEASRVRVETMEGAGRMVREVDLMRAPMPESERRCRLCGHTARQHLAAVNGCVCGSSCLCAGVYRAD